MKKVFSVSFIIVLLTLIVGCSQESKGESADAQNDKESITIKYSHPNAPESVAGKQADLFADLVDEKTEGRVQIEVFPSGQLGNLQEITESVELGTIGMSHNTMAANGSLFEDLAALDTPYLFKDVNHMDKAMAIDSPLMESLNEKFVEQNGVRLLYTFYFGTRHLTVNKEVTHPDDLKGVKIRSIPFDIYTATVEGMGAEAVPIDWNEVPTSLQTGVIDGQENPLDVVVSNSLYELQDYLMLTGHIIASSGVIINEEVWQSISNEDQEKLIEAATEARSQALEWNTELEDSALSELKEKGMNIIGEEEGLDLKAFEEKISSLIEERFSDKFDYIYEEVNKID